MMDATQVAENAKDYVYLDLCQSCVWDVHPTMLTGYCLRDCKCDRCGRVSDLAITLEVR